MFVRLTWFDTTFEHTNERFNVDFHIPTHAYMHIHIYTHAHINASIFRRKQTNIHVDGRPLPWKDTNIGVCRSCWCSRIGKMLAPLLPWCNCCCRCYSCSFLLIGVRYIYIIACEWNTKRTKNGTHVHFEHSKYISVRSWNSCNKLHWGQFHKRIAIIYLFSKWIDRLKWKVEPYGRTDGPFQYDENTKTV